MKAFLFLIPILLAPFVSAASITTSTSCGSIGAVVNGTDTCSIGVDDLEHRRFGDGAYARTSISYTVPTGTGPLITEIGAFVSAACGSTNTQICKPYYATASARLSVTLNTTGPARSGYVTFSHVPYGWEGTGDGFSGGWGIDMQRGPGLSDIKDGCSGRDGFCDSGRITDISWPFPTQVILGAPVTITETLSALATGDMWSGYGAGGTDVNIQFHFFEADGTPVALTDPAPVPEPSTWALTLFPLGFVLWTKRRFDKPSART